MSRILPLLFLVACAPERSSPSLSLLETWPKEGGQLPAAEYVQLQFDHHLHPDSAWSQTARLRSGELRFNLEILYDPLKRALLLRPPQGFRPNLAYTLTLSEGLRSSEGYHLNALFELNFLALPAAARPRPVSVEFEDLRPLFEQRCGCHGPEPLLSPELRPEYILEKAAQRGEGLLISPGRPLHSLLFLRLLEDWPQRGALMPPDGPLSEGEIRQVLDWIRGL